MIKKFIYSFLSLVLCLSLLFGGCVNNGQRKDAENVESAEMIKYLNTQTCALDSDKDFVNPKAGLRNPYIVGVDGDRFNNEMLYEIPTENTVVIDVAKAPYNVKADDKKDDAKGLQTAIENARQLPENQVKIIRLPKGRIDIIEGCNGIDMQFGLVFRDLKNVVFDGNGADLMISMYLNMIGFLIQRCENIQFHNFTVDYTYPPYMMGRVIRFDAEKNIIEVKVNEGYHVDSNLPLTQYMEYDPISLLPKSDGNALGNTAVEHSIEKTKYIHNEDGSYTVCIKGRNPLKPVDINTPVSIGVGYYVAPAFQAKNCKNFVFEHVTVYTAWGVTLHSYSVENLYINHFRNICKPGTDRLFTNSACCFHVKNSSGIVKITNSLVENNYDDGVNIAGHMMNIKFVDAENKTVTAKYKSGMWGTFCPEIGEKYELTNVNTFDVPAVLTVSGVTFSEDGYIMSFEETSKEPGEERYFDFAKITTGYTLANATRVPKIVIENNVFRNEKNRGLLLQSRDVVVKNNLFSDILLGAIYLIADTKQFSESISPSNVLIENNKFLRCSGHSPYGDIQAFAWTPNNQIKDGVVKDVDIVNNFFGQSYNTSVSLRFCKDIRLTANLFYQPGFEELEPLANSALYSKRSKGIALTKNKVIADIDPGFMSINIEDEFKEEDFILTDNAGMSLDSNKGVELVTLELNKVQDSAFKIDGDLTEWKDITTQIIMVSATEGYTKVNVDAIDPSSLKIVSKLTYSDTGLYFAFDIRDDKIVWHKQWWQGDHVELFLTNVLDSGERIGTFNTLCPDESFGQFALGEMNFTAWDDRSDVRVVAGKEKIVSKFVITEDGYCGEVFIPFEIIPKIQQSVVKGQEVAFSLVVGDSDDASDTKILRVASVNYPSQNTKQTPNTMNRFICK